MGFFNSEYVLVEYDPEVEQWAVYFYPKIFMRKRLLESFNGLSEKIGYDASLSRQIKQAKEHRDTDPEYTNRKLIVIDKAWSKINNQDLPFGEDQFLIIENDADEIEAILRFG